MVDYCRACELSHFLHVSRIILLLFGASLRMTWKLEDLITN